MFINYNKEQIFIDKKVINKKNLHLLKEYMNYLQLLILLKKLIFDELIKEEINTYLSTLNISKELYPFNELNLKKWTDMIFLNIFNIEEKSINLYNLSTYYKSGQSLNINFEYSPKYNSISVLIHISFMNKSGTILFNYSTDQTKNNMINFFEYLLCLLRYIDRNIIDIYNLEIYKNKLFN